MIMFLKKKRLAVLFLLIFSSSLYSQEITFVKKPTMEKKDDKYVINFSLSGNTDVEVSILNAKNIVVKHLVAGVVGGETPAPLPLIEGLDQTINWDGMDDYGVTAIGGPFKVRVRAGMNVQLDKIAGGNPYAFYSKEMGHGDHSAWKLRGLEIKSNGRVYIMANSTNLGQPVIREFDIEGNFIKTVFPPGANLNSSQVEGWGILKRNESDFSFLYSDLGSVSLSNTFISGWRSPMPFLVPSAKDNELILCSDGFDMMKVYTDGSVDKSPELEGKFVKEPSLFGPVEGVKGDTGLVTGQILLNLSHDKKFLYLGGIYAAKFFSWRKKLVGAEKEGFWRDGQVFKIDLSTGKASVFFALDGEKVITDMADRNKSPIADAQYGHYSAIHGVVEDKNGNVFVCDRQNERIVILDKDAKIIKEIPCKYPDAIAVSPNSNALYVTTRYGHYHSGGKLSLLKFNDWSKDSQASKSFELCEARFYSEGTFLQAVESKGETLVWVAYTGLPVQIFKDNGKDFSLYKDFGEIGDQSALDLQHFIVDQRNENIYVSDGFGILFRLTNWDAPKFEVCYTKEKEQIHALSVALDVKNDFLYTHHHMSTVRRYRLDGNDIVSAPFKNSNANDATPHMCNDWRINLGQGDRGMAAAPDGSLATLGFLQKGGAEYSGPLNFYKADMNNGPWTPLFFNEFGAKPRSAGVRFDLQGNLYAGKAVSDEEYSTLKTPKGFENYRANKDSVGFIYKYAPTGKAGDLFPKAPEKPERVYKVNYGSISPRFTRTPLFGVDQFGRIYYPNTLLPKVCIIDNSGNDIINFGTWANRDSLGGLKGDLVPTKDIPMAWPSSVDATDDYVYVSDLINSRLLRLKKVFKIEGTN